LHREKAIPAGTGLGEIEWGRPKKSEQCPDGYKGRIGIHEVLEMSSAIRQLIMKNATSEEIELEARREGMLSIRDEGLIRAARRTTSLEEVFRVTSE